MNPFICGVELLLDVNLHNPVAVSEIKNEKGHSFSRDTFMRSQ